MKAINLTKEMVSIVDDNVYDEISKYKWYCSVGYAMCDLRRTKKNVPYKGQQLMMHRLVMMLNGHDLNGKYVDHINGDRLDNRYVNLRICTQAQNSYNAGKKKIGCSVYKGLFIDKRRPNSINKWGIQIKINYKSNHIGFINDEVLAAKIYDSVVRYYHKEFAKTNFETHDLNPMSIQEAKNYINQLKLKNYGTQSK